MKHRTVLSNAGHWFVELLHHDSDPGLWIIRRWKKFLWFKTHRSSVWFNDREQALAFAVTIQLEHDGREHHAGT